MQNRPLTGPISPDYAAFEAVAIASSLGGPDALRELLRRISPHFPAAVLVAQHLFPGARSLPRFLALDSALPVKEAEDGEPVRPGWVYVGPAERHLMVTAARRVHLSDAAPVKFCRPAAERLLLSVAATYRERALGVVLTGCNTDGTLGFRP